MKTEVWRLMERRRARYYLFYVLMSEKFGYRLDLSSNMHKVVAPANHPWNTRLIFTPMESRGVHGRP